MPDSVRLLKLKPGDSDALLEGTLTVVSLSDPGLAYRALSYTWGNPLDEDSRFFEPHNDCKYYLNCGGKHIEILKNLRDALWQLRQLGEFSYLWIDAICINQNNNSEKSQQIKLMPELYSKASLVNIWLGKSDETSDEAIDLIRTNPAANLESLMQPAGQSLSKFEFTTQQWQAIANLLLRKWFTRLWTLQEVIIPTTTTALCGSRRFEIDEATVLAAALLRTNLHFSMLNIARPLQVARATDGLCAAATIGAWLGISWPSGGFGSRAFLRYAEIDYKLRVPRSLKWLVALEVLVHEMRQRECCDWKDKIMAPLAFAIKYAPISGYEKFEDRINDLLNHSNSTSELYRKFTTFMIDSMGNLDILSRVDGRHWIEETKLNLPSWVPHFNDAGISSLVDELLFTKFDVAKFLGLRSNNGGKTEQSLNLRDYCSQLAGSLSDSPELRVDAVFCSRILMISKYWAQTDSIGSWFALALDPSKSQSSHETFLRKDLATDRTTVTDDQGDIAHLISKAYTKPIIQAREKELEASNARVEYMRVHLSALSISQLNVQVR